MIPYLQAESLSKRWGEALLFDNLSFTIGKDQKVALIAKNGAGKSTLLDILAGLDIADEGIVTLTNDVTIGYLKQEPDLDENLTIIEQVLVANGAIADAISSYEKAIESEDADLMESAMTQMNAVDGWDVERRFKQLLTELKITYFDRTIGTLSGGQRKRVALALVLISEPDIVILDEPTNHLDLDMIEWLERYLERTKSTLFMVTHDRYFLDRVCNVILELDDNTIYRYNGNYSYYIEKREERIAQAAASVDKAKNLYKTELEWLRRMPKARGGKSKYRIEAAADLKRRATNRRVDKSISLDFKASRLGNKIIELQGISKSFDDLTILKDFSYSFSRFEKIGIVGENGSGKSTFLNVLTGAIAADSGIIDVGTTVKFGYYHQQGIKFDPEANVIDIIKEIGENIDLGDGRVWSASQFLLHFLFTPEMQFTRVAKLSGGERRRLYLCTVLMHNPNFLILDEPTNDLDIVTLNVLEEYLTSFNGCVIIVSHDRYFMDKIVDHMFVFSGGGEIKDFPGNYTIYRDWVDDQKREEQKRLQADRLIEDKRREAEEVKVTVSEPVSRPTKMSYKEKREFEQIESDMPRLEEERDKLEVVMNSTESSVDEIVEASQRHSKILEELEEREMRWLELSELT